MSLHIPASQLPSKEVLLLIFGVLVVVFLDLFANWWMGGRHERPGKVSVPM
jgi:hypothetical protein